MDATNLESVVIRTMLNDSQLPLCRQSFDVSTLVVTDRNLSEVGFFTSFVRTAESKIFNEEISMRWGKVIGRINSSIDVDFVVFVDDGYLTGVEGTTFGGEPWPSEVLRFELTDLQDLETSVTS